MEVICWEVIDIRLASLGYADFTGWLLQGAVSGDSSQDMASPWIASSDRLVLSWRCQSCLFASMRILDDCDSHQV